MALSTPAPARALTRANMARLLRRIVARLNTPAIIRRVRADRLTYLEPAALVWLYEAVQQIETESVPGAIIEAGCALGGSTIVIASAKRPERPMKAYDTFAMIPPPSERDGADVHERYAEIVSGRSAGIGGDQYYGYHGDLLGKVRDSFVHYGLNPEKNHIEFIKGLFQDTLHPSGPIALAHIDGDWYDSVTTCLERIVPRLAPGGRLIIDDYFAYSGCRDAIGDYFRARMDDDFRFVYGPRLLIRRADRLTAK